MNQLAIAIHAFTADLSQSDFDTLSNLERSALQELDGLLQKSEPELAKQLLEEPEPGEWLLV